jgi:hypothetical protein
VLTRIFVGLCSKKKADIPIDDLKKLAAVFDTTEDPILSMKEPIGEARRRRGYCACLFARQGG